MIVQRVLIIGGGISGLTAGAALAGRGVDVDLVEIRDKIGDIGGVGLSIMGNAIQALSTIGAGQACVDAGMPADTFTVRNPAGEIVATPEWPPLGGTEWPSQTGISRSDFHRILADAAISAGTKFFCGVTVKSIEQDEDKAHVVFTDGRTDSYDLVLGADGIYSETRKMIFPDAAGPQPVGLGIWRAYAPRPEGITTTQLHFGGDQAVVGICPINEKDCYVYCMHESFEGERRDPNTLHEQLQEKLSGYQGPVHDLSAQLTDPSLVNYRPLEWLLHPAPWYKGRVLLIGDAVHTNPPNIAQGAAMGIEDGVVLAEEMAKSGTVEEALVRFMERRWERAKLVVEASRKIAYGEAGHDSDFDATAEINAASAVVAEPY